ncbi:lisH domain-containing protein ARMC9-like isoform X2 [Venturia canescens]|uniref:lisH domain-containing protein ARMC9-like isoform X2 n=1 Tax=Venturia canescens TaxID=32260 RepID=UPI001C9CB8C9|nr:lisH domain-containing protein ARMC9-like isoform X2 [Venturia canescens]
MDHVQDPSIPKNGASIELSETNQNRLLNARQSRLTKDIIDAAPTDREIPRFLQDDLEEVLGISHSDKPSSFQSKGVQTRISGVRTISNILYTNDFGHPVTVMNPSMTPRDPSSCISYSSELILTRSHLYNVHCNYEKLKSRFHKLHQDYYKLLRVTGELTMALDNSARGHHVDLPSTLKSCMNIYPDLFHNNVRDDNTEIKSIKSEIELQQHDLTASKQPILGIAPVSSKQLDFKKIKLHLINANVKTKLLLLQALRWKITLSQPAERDEAVHEYTSSDLMGIHGQIANDSGKSILPYLLIPLDVVLPHPLQQSTARLLNTLASLRCGRDYLSVGPAVLNVVIQCLDTAKAETVDAFTCDMILAMLQKMSLRRQQRLYMISMGLVEWLIYHLRAESKSIGTYRLEYTTALLMNLSLHREAQVRASTMTTLVLSTLTELLSSSHVPALPYINGTLNNFLANRTINEEAKKMGLDAVLEYHRKRNSGEIRRHLDYILNRLRRHSEDSIEDNNVMEDDDKEQLDVLENELDDLDPVKVHAGELFGEALLATCYSVSPNITNVLSTRDDHLITSLSRLSNGELPESSHPQSDEVSKASFESSTQEKIMSPRDGEATAVKSATTWISAYENSPEVDDKTSSIASLSAEKSGVSDTNEESKLREKVEQNDEDDAFVSKPRITRTPPHSAVIRNFRPSYEVTMESKDYES